MKWEKLMFKHNILFLIVQFWKVFFYIITLSNFKSLCLLGWFPPKSHGHCQVEMCFACGEKAGSREVLEGLEI